MEKYIITKAGMTKLLEYKMNNNNFISINEKILAVLSSGLGYTPSSLYGCAKADAAIKSKLQISEGMIIKTLQKLEAENLVQSYDDSMAIPMNGGVSNG